MPFSAITNSGLLFLLTIVSGVWLSHLGRPLNDVVFAVHKLSALGTVILVAININRLYKLVDVAGIVKLVATPVTGLLFLALFVSGAVLTLVKPIPEAMLLLHRIAPILALLATTATLYLLTSAQS